MEEEMLRGEDSRREKRICGRIEAVFLIFSFLHQIYVLVQYMYVLANFLVL